MREKQINYKRWVLIYGSCIENIVYISILLILLASILKHVSNTCACTTYFGVNALKC